MRQANQQKGNGPVVERFAVAPFPFSKWRVLNGPEPSRARCICAAKRTLDGEDRSRRIIQKGKGAGSQGPPPRGLGQSPDSL